MNNVAHQWSDGWLETWTEIDCHCSDEAVLTSWPQTWHTFSITGIHTITTIHQQQCANSISFSLLALILFFFSCNFFQIWFWVCITWIVLHLLLCVITAYVSMVCSYSLINSTFRLLQQFLKHLTNGQHSDNSSSHTSLALLHAVSPSHEHPEDTHPHTHTHKMHTETTGNLNKREAF